MPRVEDLELDIGNVIMKKPLMREMDKIGNLLSKAKEIKNEEETSEAVRNIAVSFCKDYMVDFSSDKEEQMTTDDMWKIINWVLNKYSGGMLDKKKLEQ